MLQRVEMIAESAFIDGRLALERALTQAKVQ
jgi:hypothetical protein